MMQIKRWDTDALIFEGEGDLRKVLEAAVVAGVDLYRARLVGARLVGARLELIKVDIYEVLAAAPAEVPTLLATLRAGKIDGSVYNDGADCVCLVGTLEKARGCPANGIVARNLNRAAEIWFLALKPGHTPANHPVAKITEQWIEEWLLSNPSTGEAQS